MQFGVTSIPARTAGALVIAGTLALGSACGTSPQVTADPVIDIARLDVGSYPTTPRELGPVKNADQARFIEAERLGNFVPTASDIDPAFREGNPSVSTVFIDPRNSLGKIMSIDRFAEAAPDFVAGFLSNGSTDVRNQGRDLFNAVMIFPDEQRAAAAAEALERVDFEAAPQNERVQIPKYPAARAHWQPTQQSIGSWFATGKFVVYTWIYDYLKIFLEKVDLPALFALVEKSLDAVVPAIGKFTPTPADQLLNQPIDYDNMLSRTLPRPREDSWIDPPGAYNGHAALHFTTDPAEDRRLIEEAGVDRFAVDATNVYRARDAAAAAKFRADRGGLTKRFKSAESPQQLPVAKCKEYIGTQAMAVRFYCSVSQGRYAAFSWSHQLLDAQQRISAQYAILVNAR
ncbi:hypothetical protein FG87_30070 [Nocardia vulneris]|uniref:Uncharacterized protein n=1 Tax=Nocardia vulneris TaxID=1141657 RepID=A0ABR4Z8S0_9NOCA|nr:hypothetical protein FG87_30070 [Nocardia vulneris]